MGIDAVDGFRTPAAPLPLWATQGFTTTTTTSTAGEGKAGGERGQRRLAYTEPRNTTDDRGMSGAPILKTKNKLLELFTTGLIIFINILLILKMTILVIFH